MNKTHKKKSTYLISRSGTVCLIAKKKFQVSISAEDKPDLAGYNGHKKLESYQGGCLVIQHCDGKEGRTEM